MNRRDFLVKSSLASSAILTSDTISANPIFANTQKPKSVVIIGAGLAGLSAARRLIQEGVDVKILEARNRIGGRVFSFQPPMANGQIIEFGAEWVGHSHERVIALCEEFGLELENNQFDSDLILNGNHSPKGKWSFGSEMQAFWKDKVNIWENMTPDQKVNLDKTDWWRFLYNQGVQSSDLFLRDLLDSTDFGESIRHTSAYGALAEYAESSEKNEMDLKIKGGNARLVDKLAESVGLSNILLSHSVKSIKQLNGQAVEVICDNGTHLKADKIICAIPTASVLKIDWQPALPSEMVAAMHELQYARIGKFPVVFSERFWQREDFDMLTDTPAHYFYHGTKNQEGKTGVLMCYAVGDKADALASVSKSQRLDIILNALQPAFGDVRKYVIEDLMYYWGHDNFSNGAYAFYGKSQWFDVMPVLKKPFGNIYFAGEHLADWQGFMEGAINTGEDAVDEILSQ